MSTWQVIKVLLENTTIYRRKLLFFVILIVAASTVYALFATFGITQAYIQPGEPIAQTSFGQVNMDIVLEKNGRVLINGQKQNNVFRLYSGYDELRIMVFDAPGQFIPAFKAIVHLPEPTPQDSVKQIIYAVHGVGVTQTYTQGEQTLIYEAYNISPQATLTIVANLPKGLIQPGQWQKLVYQSRNLQIRAWLKIAIILPSITFLVMMAMVVVKRRDQFFLIKKNIQVPPENLPPAVSGVLIDGYVGPREIAATLIDLARRRYIDIIYKGKGEFTFGKRFEDLDKAQGLSSFEKVLLAKIFLPQAYKSTQEDVEMRLGRHLFSHKIAQFYLEVYNQATRQGYFRQNPARVHLVYKYSGIVLFFLSFFGFIFGATTGMDPKYSLLFWVGGMAAAAVMIKLSPMMPGRTSRGSAHLRDWLGFRHYLISRERARGTELLSGKFEEYLPYAIVLGAEIEWTRRFFKEPFTKPEWYESPEGNLTLENFANELFPLIGFVARHLARSHEPTVE